MSVERFMSQNHLLALVVRRDFVADDIHFFTESDSSQQLGYMNRAAGYVVHPHRHNETNRHVAVTQEVLLIRTGSCRLDLYGDGDSVIESTILMAGDVALLAHGGHGLVMLEPTQIIEVKQGPFGGDEDKTRFTPRGDLL